jgi:glycosyltransferase involved in cell wall biosynthesis
LRVVLLSHEYPPFQFGGIGIFVKDLAKGMADLGLNVTVISGRPVPWKNDESINLVKQEGSVTVIRLPYPNVVPRHIAFQLYNKSKIEEILKELKPDIIHWQSGQAFPAIVSIKKKAPGIVTFHASPAVQKTLGLKSIGKGGSFGDFLTCVMGYPAYEFGYRREYKNACAKVAVSESLMKQLSDEMNIDDGAFQYIRNGVDLRNLEELISASSNLNQSANKPTLLFGGRLFWSKGVLDLVDVAYLLEKKYNLDFNMVIYGSGPMYNRILQKKEMYGLNNLVLRDFASRSIFLREMINSTLVLMPSLFEGAPMMLIESMCLGKVPVMFNFPYAREFTENGKYGLICNNVQDMALKITRVLQNGSIPKLENQIRGFAKENYNIVKTATAYYKLYKQYA